MPLAVRRKRALVTVALVAAALLVPVFVTDTFYLHLIILSVIWSILASSLNLCLGYVGLLSVAHGAFFGIGAYATSLLVLKLEWNFWLAVPGALLLILLMSLAISVLALRTRGHYFVIFTLCFGLIVTVVIDHWEALTEGSRGLTNVPPIDPIPLPGLGVIPFISMVSQYYLFVLFLAVVLATNYLLVHSRYGRAFEAIKLNETVAESLGINVMRQKTFAFCLSAVFAGVGGAVYAPYIAYLNPADTSFWISFDAILFVVVGGAGTVLGPLVGAFAMTILPEMLRFFEEFRLFFYAAVLILTVIFFPAGLVGLPGLLLRLAARIRALPATRRRVALPPQGGPAAARAEEGKPD
jgi:branched-chain amino acid transport system permease protein